MSGKSDSAPLYPVMLQLRNQRCVVVGGGAVAERKIEGLLAAQADIVVISPRFTERILGWIEEGAVQGIAKRYESKDVSGAALVFAATDDSELNRTVAADSRASRIFVNVASEADDGNFTNPYVMRRGKLVISVSTSGASPIAARRICEDVEERGAADYEAYLAIAERFRTVARRTVGDAQLRRRLTRTFMQIDWLGQIREGLYRPWTDAEMRRWIAERLEE